MSASRSSRPAPDVLGHSATSCFSIAAAIRLPRVATRWLFCGFSASPALDPSLLSSGCCGSSRRNRRTCPSAYEFFSIFDAAGSLSFFIPPRRRDSVMKAVVLYEYGDVDQLQYKTDQPELPFGPDEVRVRVRATSINPIDWKLRSGAARARMPLNLPTILGRDLSGEVADMGSDVTAFKKGQRVMALANGT